MAKCVVAEDEALLREALVALLRQSWPDLDIVAECEDGGSALEAIAREQPEVAFLDIRMPGLTGLEVAAAATEASPGTQVVFVTAYDQYAIDAFDTGAVDYLLKPVAAERLAATVQRLQARLASGQVDSSLLAALLQRLSTALPRKTQDAPLAWITASVGKETRLIMVDDVAYFRADNKYTVGGHRRRRSAGAKTHPRPARGPRPAAFQAGASRHDRQPARDRRHRPRRHRQGHDQAQVAPGNPGRQPALHAPLPQHVKKRGRR